MLRREDDAIVLETRPHGEADRLVALLTGRGERLWALAPAAARSRRRFGGALQPGARVRARWTVRREDAPPVLDEAVLVAAPPTPDPLVRYYATAHVIDVVSAFAREGDEDPRLFRLLAATLDRLAAGDEPEPLARYVEAWTLRLAGLMPEIGTCAACGAPLAGSGLQLARAGGAFCGLHAPPGSWTLGPAAAAWLAAIRGLAPGRLPPADPPLLRELATPLTGTIMTFTERPLRGWDALEKELGR
jgi:DNA repair protein RecO (recombination protein O)